jgi:hypothetical protein
MYYTGIFDDLNYISYDEFDEQAALKEWMKSVRHSSCGYTKLEFMDYVIKGMKRFLQSPFQQ